MQDSTCLVTGASSGLGYAFALGLAKRGANVVMLCRNPEKGKQARINLIKHSQNPNIDLMPCDLSSMEEVRNFAEEFMVRYKRLDVLANIAGAIHPYYATTDEGFEKNFATNIAGPFLLTALLLQRMLDSGPSTILNISGEAHRTGRLHFEDFNLKSNYSFSKAGKQAALARIVWTFELANRLNGLDTTANSFCPGWTISDLAQHFPPLFAFLYKQLAQRLAESSENAMAPMVDFVCEKALFGVNGQYLVKGKPADPAPISRYKGVGRRLWNILEEMLGIEGQVERVINRSKIFTTS